MLNAKQEYDESVQKNIGCENSRAKTAEPEAENRMKNARNYALSHYEDLYLFAYSYLKNEAAAANAVTNSIYHSMKNLRKLNAQPKMQNWFYQLLLRATLKSLHRSAGTERHFTDNSQIYAYMETLPQNQTAAFKLYHFADMNIGDIAEILNLKNTEVADYIEKTSANLKVELKLDEASRKKLDELQRIYEEPAVPETLYDDILIELERERSQFTAAEQKKKRNKIRKPLGLLLLLLVIYVLTCAGMRHNPDFARAIGSMPLIGKFFPQF